jgi:hypothetical protein
MVSQQRPVVARHALPLGEEQAQAAHLLRRQDFLAAPIAGTVAWA